MHVLAGVERRSGFFWREAVAATGHADGDRGPFGFAAGGSSELPRQLVCVAGRPGQTQHGPNALDAGTILRSGRHVQSRL